MRPRSRRGSGTRPSGHRAGAGRGGRGRGGRRWVPPPRCRGAGSAHVDGKVSCGPVRTEERRRGTPPAASRRRRVVPAGGVGRERQVGVAVAGGGDAEVDDVGGRRVAQAEGAGELAGGGGAAAGSWRVAVWGARRAAWRPAQAAPSRRGRRAGRRRPARRGRPRPSRRTPVTTAAVWAEVRRQPWWPSAGCREVRPRAR